MIRSPVTKNDTASHPAAHNALDVINALQPGAHLCCLYESEEEHRTLLTSFMRGGLERDEKVMYILDDHTARTIRAYLREAGLNVYGHIQAGCLHNLYAYGTYLQDEEFRPERTIDFLAMETERALAEGYSALRVTGEMSWVLRGFPGSERLLEYEAMMNSLLAGSPCIAMCQYDLRRFDQELLRNVITAHPLVVLNAEVYEKRFDTPRTQAREEALTGSVGPHRQDNSDGDVGHETE